MNVILELSHPRQSASDIVNAIQLVITPQLHVKGAPAVLPYCHFLVNVWSVKVKRSHTTLPLAKLTINDRNHNRVIIPVHP